MNANKRATLSKGRSYQEIGEFWESHDLGDFWQRTRRVRFKVAIGSAATYCPVESGLAARLRSVAQKRGISAETLLNLWLQERLEAAEKAI